jgi:hypothetical protein
MGNGTDEKQQSDAKGTAGTANGSDRGDYIMPVEDKYDVNVTIEQVRQELETLRLKREENRKKRPKELKELQRKFQAAKKNLQLQLSQRAHQATYIRFLKHEYYEIEERKQQEKAKTDGSRPRREIAPISTYIVQQEAPLLSALHWTFWIYPGQEKVTKEYYQEHIIPYFEKKVWTAKVDRDNLEIVDKVTKLAQENTNLYDSYQRQLEAQEQELRELRRQLIASGYCEKKDIKLLSQSQHSHTTMDSDTEIDGEEDKSESTLDSPFVHVTKLLMTPTESISNSIGGGLHSLKMMAGEKFHLPFGQ